MFILPIFPSKIQPSIIVIFSILVLLSIFREKIKFDKKFFLINSGVYLLMILSLIYTENIDYGLKKLLTMLPLIIFPIIFSFAPSPFIKHIVIKKYNYMYLYVIAIFILNISFFLYHYPHYRLDTVKHYPILISIAQDSYSIHAIYLSIYISIAIIFSFFLLKKEKKRIKTFILYFIDLILLGFLLILMKKGPVLGLGIVFTMFVLFQNKKQLWYFYFFSLTFLAVIIYNTPKLKIKFEELSNIETIKNGNLTSTNIRYSIYRYAKETISKSPIIGYGIGDYRDELIKVYKANSPSLYKEEYNSHNQYLSFIISIGFIGLIAFITMLGYNFICAIKFKNQLLILIIIFYCFVMSFENVLERQLGVIMFSFFINFFSFIKREE